MKKELRGLIPILIALLAVNAVAQKKKGSETYIGYVYPAGGQQGTTFEVRVGGQQLDDIYGVIVSGDGVQAKMTEYRRKLNPQITKLLKEQKKIYRKKADEADSEVLEILARSERVMADYVRQPASASISILAFLEVTIDKNAEPGPREIRLQTAKGLSNPLPFYVGQLPEVSRKPMRISNFQVLGREQAALRSRPDDEVEQKITPPCILNGQIASGEVNQYRFHSKKGQKLVITTLARQLVPYIADAVPGWFQPVLTLQDADGNEVAFNDDYRFKPDPTILYDVEKDGEYLLTVKDAIYRGREDFIYRITIGETPFITSIFPLGSKTGKQGRTNITGWNLQKSRIILPSELDTEGVHMITANRKDLISNQVPFELCTLREYSENEPDNSLQTAQNISLPAIINGRSDQPGDQDLFKIRARKGDTLVAEVRARRLDSPLDSALKITDSSGNILAYNDDHADPASGLNTHHADSYIMLTLPENGDYYIHLNDIAGNGGDAYTYRLRISKPRPDFELRTVPSRINIRGNSGGSVDVYAIRKDGYEGPIQLRLGKDTPNGFSARPVTLRAGEEKVRFTIRPTRIDQKDPVAITIEGSATINSEEIVHQAVPSEDWMQAFLWRHLVPTQELMVQVFVPGFLPKPDRPVPETDMGALTSKPFQQMTPEEKQISGSIRQLGNLFTDGLITKDFYRNKMDEFKEYKASKK